MDQLLHKLDRWWPGTEWEAMHDLYLDHWLKSTKDATMAVTGIKEQWANSCSRPPPLQCDPPPPPPPPQKKKKKDTTTTTTTTILHTEHTILTIVPCAMSMQIRSCVSFSETLFKKIHTKKSRISNQQTWWHSLCTIFYASTWQQNSKCYASCIY